MANGSNAPREDSVAVQASEPGASRSLPTQADMLREIRPISRNVKNGVELSGDSELPDRPVSPEQSAPILRKGWRSLRDPAVLEKYIMTLAATGRYTAAASMSGVSRRQADLLRNSDESFGELCAEAIARYHGSLEAEAHERAVNGVSVPVWHQGQLVGYEIKASDRLLELLLKRHIPEYRDAGARPGTTVNVHASAVAGTTEPVAGPQALDPSRMTREQREAYRAFLAAMAEPGLSELPAPAIGQRPMLDASSSDLPAAEPLASRQRPLESPPRAFEPPVVAEDPTSQESRGEDSVASIPGSVPRTTEPG